MVPILADIAGGELQLLSSGQVVLDIKNTDQGPAVEIFLAGQRPRPSAWLMPNPGPRA